VEDPGGERPNGPEGNRGSGPGSSSVCMANSWSLMDEVRNLA
jgi:hypothetical protein